MSSSEILWNKLESFLIITDTKPVLSIVFLAFNAWICVFLLCFFISWLLVPSFRKFDLIKRSDWTSRVVSTINACVGCIFFSKFIFQEKSLFETGNYAHSAAASGLWKLLLGYFFYDSVLIALVFEVHDAINIQTLIHHAVVTMAVIYCLISRDPLAMYWASSLFLTEGSTPLVNIRWFLSECDLKHTKLYTMVGIFMTLSFFIFRIVFMPWTLYVLLSNPNILWNLSNYRCFCDGVVGGMVFICIYVLNGYWFYLMLRGFIVSLNQLCYG
eukprot:jgi/Galph1/2655/GphlegSOOS_G1284.1